MDTLEAGFWGAFFGTVALMLAGALLAYVRSLQRVALTAALSAVFSAFYAIAFLGWLPVGDGQVQSRLLAHVSVVCSTALGLMLLAMLGLLRRPRTRGRIFMGMGLTGLGVLAAGWLMAPTAALALSSALAVGIGIAGMLMCVRSARRGDRLAWVAVSGVGLMLVAVTGLAWIALDRDGVPWQVYAASALSGMAYLAAMASALWVRYSYLIELREVMSHGPAYDPVTRMRTHAETGQMVGAAFFREGENRKPVGVLVVSIGNFYALENLHGRGAVNHALFVCASRLRRVAPVGVEMGRLSDDGFLLLVRNAADSAQLVRLARQIAMRLARPVSLSTGRATDLETGGTQWVADVGVGVLQATVQVKPASAVAMARAMSRTAWSYGSRVAWYDRAAEQIAELPASDD